MCGRRVIDKSFFDRPTVHETSEPEPLRPVLARVSDDSHRARPRPDENTFQSPSRRAVVSFDMTARRRNGEKWLN
jgi:hypothetical protein